VSGPHTVVIVNPAAAGGRSARGAARWIAALGAVRVVRTDGPGHAAEIARTCDADLVVAAGGDGTVHEVANGLLGRATPVALGILPVGTGNSFVRDLGLDPAGSVDAIRTGRRRRVDAVRMTADDRTVWSLNLVSLGFTAAVGSLTNRRFKPIGAGGYVASVVVEVGRLHPGIYAHRLDGGALDERPAVLLSFSNSRYTGGSMAMAPNARIDDGLLDVVRVGPMGRARLLTAFPRIFAGSHLSMSEVSSVHARRVDFELAGTIDVLVDGELLRCRPVSLEVVPGALEVAA
jgi:diacylglycerol kinase (ATP)